MTAGRPLPPSLLAQAPLSRHPERVRRAHVQASGCPFVDELLANVQSSDALGMPAICYTPDLDLEAAL